MRASIFSSCSLFYPSLIYLTSHFHLFLTPDNDGRSQPQTSFLSVHMANAIRLMVSASLIRYTGVGEAG
jgi:hypothetical protein